MADSSSVGASTDRQRNRFSLTPGADELSNCATAAGCWFTEPGCDAHQIVGEYGSADQHLEALDAFSEAALHAAAAEQHGDAPLDAGPEALSLLEGGCLLVSLTTPRNFPAADLRDAGDLDAVALAQGLVPLAEEAAIGAVQLGRPAKHLPVAVAGSAGHTARPADCPAAPGTA